MREKRREEKKNILFPWSIHSHKYIFSYCTCYCSLHNVESHIVTVPKEKLKFDYYLCP
jgi:hypothetical protein